MKRIITLILLSAILFALFLNTNMANAQIDVLPESLFSQPTEEDYQRMVEAYKLEIKDFESKFGRDNLSCAITLDWIANCYVHLRQRQTAYSYFLQSFDIFKNILPPLDYASYVCCTINEILEYGDYSIAQMLLPEVLCVIDENTCDISDEYETVLCNVGLLKLHLGDYDRAYTLLNRAIAIHQIYHKKDDLGYAACLNNMAIYYCKSAKYGEALHYFSQAQAICKECTEFVDTEEYATLLSNIGSCYSGIGDSERAFVFFQQSLDIIKRTKGEGSANYAVTLCNIGDYYMDVGELDKAHDAYISAVNIFENTVGVKSVFYATGLSKIGDYYSDNGDYEKSLDYYNKALDVTKQGIGENTVEYANRLLDIGIVCVKNKRYLNAVSYLRQAQDIFDVLECDNMPEYSIILGFLSYCYMSQRKIEEAISCLSQYYQSNVSLMKMSFPWLSEQQRERLWAQYDYMIGDRLFIIAGFSHISEMNKLAYNCALFSKGLLLNTEIEMRKLILESGDEAALRMYEEMRGSRAYLDKLYESPEGKKHEIDSLNNLIETQQRELAKRSKEFGDYSRNLIIKWDDVKSALGKKDIAIEFATYTSQDTTHYIALTLKSDYTEPHSVELFNDKELERSNPAGAAWYSQIKSTNLIWGNLSDELKGVDNVYFSPAGELNNIGIEYLLDEDGKHILSEKRNYYRLSSTRELVKSHQIKKASDAVVYGGILYDVTPKSKLTGKETETELLAKAASRQYILDSLPRNRGEKWNYLPGTKKEAESIASTLKKNKVRNELFEGEVATEESFKALDGAKKDIIHIATHGFYYTEKEARKKDDLAFMMNGENRAPKEDKMMTRSGLLFAGAKNTFDGKEIPRDVEDGIVTAKDISRLDLRGCDLAVLSACQSGLGDIKGDGVFGLQRGFKKAGVQTLVMSLWKVDDEATRIMMTRFYENMLKGKSKYDAFKESQNYLRKKYDDPYYYAAFIILDAFE